MYDLLWASALASEAKERGVITERSLSEVHVFGLSAMRAWRRTRTDMDGHGVSESELFSSALR